MKKVVLGALFGLSMIAQPMTFAAEAQNNIVTYTAAGGGCSVNAKTNGKSTRMTLNAQPGKRVDVHVEGIGSIKFVGTDKLHEMRSAFDKPITDKVSKSLMMHCHNTNDADSEEKLAYSAALKRQS